MQIVWNLAFLGSFSCGDDSCQALIVCEAWLFLAAYSPTACTFHLDENLVWKAYCTPHQSNAPQWSSQRNGWSRHSSFPSRGSFTCCIQWHLKASTIRAWFVQYSTTNPVGVYPIQRQLFVHTNENVRWKLVAMSLPISHSDESNFINITVLSILAYNGQSHVIGGWSRVSRWLKEFLCYFIRSMMSVKLVTFLLIIFGKLMSHGNSSSDAARGDREISHMLKKITLIL